MSSSAGNFDAAAIHGDARPEDAAFVRMMPVADGRSSRVPERSPRSLARALALRMPMTSLASDPSIVSEQDPAA